MPPTAWARMAAGRVDEANFEETRQGRTASSLFEELLARRPEDLVVAYGDASLPNLLANESGFTGFVDCLQCGKPPGRSCAIRVSQAKSVTTEPIVVTAIVVATSSRSVSYCAAKM